MNLTHFQGLPATPLGTPLGRNTSSQPALQRAALKAVPRTLDDSDNSGEDDLHYDEQPNDAGSSQVVTKGRRKEPVFFMQPEVPSDVSSEYSQHETNLVSPTSSRRNSSFGMLLDSRAEGRDSFTGSLQTPRTPSTMSAATAGRRGSMAVVQGLASGQLESSDIEGMAFDPFTRILIRVIECDADGNPINATMASKDDPESQVASHIAQGDHISLAENLKVMVDGLNHAYPDRSSLIGEVEVNLERMRDGGMTLPHIRSNDLTPRPATNAVRLPLTRIDKNGKAIAAGQLVMHRFIRVSRKLRLYKKLEQGVQGEHEQRQQHLKRMHQLNLQDLRVDEEPEDVEEDDETKDKESAPVASQDPVRDFKTLMHMDLDHVPASPPPESQTETKDTATSRRSNNRSRALEDSEDDDLESHEIRNPPAHLRSQRRGLAAQTRQHTSSNIPSTKPTSRSLEDSD